MPAAWWVNQGSTYLHERRGGYVWAPTKNKAGYPVKHHVNWLPSEDAPQHWLFQANPDYWDIEVEVPKMGVGNEDTWIVSRHGGEMRPGDSLVLWKSGPRAGVYGLAELTGSLTTRPPREWRRQSPGDERPEDVVPLRYTRYLKEPVLRAEILKHPVLGQMGVIRAPQGTNFRLSTPEWDAMQELLRMDRWDEFIYWAGRYRSWSGFDAAEREHKLRLGSKMGEARTLYQSGVPEWTARLRTAIRSD